MASVNVIWSGRCPSREVQQDLCGFIEELAKRSHRFFNTPPLQCEMPSDPPVVKHWDTRIEGRILVSHSLLDEASAKKHGLELVETQVKPTPEEMVFDGVSADTVRSIRWPLLHEVRLYGTEFQLYDPRDWENDGETGDTMSFVFLSHQCPDLDGQLVVAEDHDECQYYDNEAIKQADWFLTHPSMTLRYYLEKWFDYVMGWTKHFFIPDLYYWRWHDLAGYQELTEKLDMLQAETRDKIALRKVVFEDVLERFEYEAVEWWKAFYGGRQGEKRPSRGLKYGPDVWLNAIRRAGDDRSQVMRLPKSEDRGEDVQGRDQEKVEGEAQDGLLTNMDKLEEGLRQCAAELREQGFPVTDDMRIDPDAFKGIVYPAEEVERDKATVRRLEQIRYEDATDVENIRRKLRQPTEC